MSSQIMMVILPLYSLVRIDGITISQIITSFLNLEGYWDDV